MTTKLQKISTKGQITLPVAWRKAVATEHITVTDKNGVLEIRPARLESNEMTVFDALRDNKGRGLTVADLESLCS